MASDEYYSFSACAFVSDPVVCPESDMFFPCYPVENPGELEHLDHALDHMHKGTASDFLHLSGLEFVTEGDSKFRLRIKTFDSVEEAWKHASLWGDDAIVVELNGDYEVAL